MAPRNSETRLCFNVTPVGRSLPNDNASAACRLRIMTGGGAFTIGVPLVCMSVSNLAILIADLVGGNRDRKHKTGQQYPDE